MLPHHPALHGTWNPEQISILYLIVIFCEFGQLLSESIKMFSISTSYKKSISHFSDLLCEDTCFKHQLVCWFHLLLPSPGTRRHSALLFPPLLSPSYSCFYTSISYVSLYQSLLLYWDHHQTKPLPPMLQSSILLPQSKLSILKLARFTMTKSELSLPN